MAQHFEAGPVAEGFAGDDEVELNPLQQGEAGGFGPGGVDLQVVHKRTGCFGQYLGISTCYENPHAVLNTPILPGFAVPAECDTV
jgi:hypothetical protein